MGKKFNETLKFLGSEYSVKTVDKEPCIYLKLDKYDFEISGLNSKGSYKAIIYVWNTDNRLDRQDMLYAYSKEELKDILDRLITKYSSI